MMLLRRRCKDATVCATNKNINVPLAPLAPLPHSHCSSLPSISPLGLAVFSKYVSLYHMRHCRIGLSEAGNDFFFLPAFRTLISATERDQRSAGYQAIYYPASSPLCCLSKCNLS